MDNIHTIQCPWCWEQLELYIDPQSTGQLVEDCEVCCRPWVVSVERDPNGTAQVHLERGN